MNTPTAAEKAGAEKAAAEKAAQEKAAAEKAAAEKAAKEKEAIGIPTQLRKKEVSFLANGANVRLEWTEPTPTSGVSQY